MVTDELLRMVAREAARHFEPKAPKPRRWASPLDMAQELDPTIVRTPALELINRKLVELADGVENRLLVAVSPQEGKSTLCSKWFPLWRLVDAPECRVAIVSYSDEMARRWGADIKQLVETFDGTDDSIDLEIRLRGDSRAAGRWQIERSTGGVYCVGIAGSLTGKPVDCVHGSTQILTEYGYAPIEQLHHSGRPFPRVLGFSHASEKPEWRNVVASRAITDRPLLEVVTSGGRRIVCTPDHRIHTAERGYVPADQLHAGERLAVATSGDGGVQPLRQRGQQVPIGDQSGEAWNAALLLPVLPLRKRGRLVGLRRLRRWVRTASMRSREGQAQGLYPTVLHEGLLRGIDTPSSGGSRSAAARRHVDRGSLHADHRRTDRDRVRSAALLLARGGSTLGWRQSPTTLRRVRRSSQGQGGRLPALLPGGASLHLPDDELRLLRRRAHPDAGRGREAAARRAGQLLLLARLRWTRTQGTRLPVPEVRQANRVEGPRSAVLLEGVPPNCESRRQGPGMPTVRQALLSEESSDRLLRSHLRRRRAFAAHGRHWQLALQGRHQLRRALPADAPAHLPARRQPVPSLLGTERDGPDWPQDRHAVQVEPRGTPPQRGAVGQPAGEPDPAVSDVPHGSPQVGYDTVSVVRHLYGVRDTVYDLQVDGTSNFFAGEVLVHNCLIIDDPIKDLSAAQSEAYRKRCRDFWQGVAVPRLGPGAKCLLVQTRWHEDDMAGWLLASEGEGDKAKGGRWQVVSIPALAEDDGDILGRHQGEYMQSARGDRDWPAIRRSVGEYVWASLYQQRPSPAEGGMFKRLWWRYFSLAPNLGYGERLDLAGRIFAVKDCWRFATIDLAASTKTSADWTVVAAWALTTDGDLVLLDRVRARIGEGEHYAAVQPLAERWALDTAFVERSQYGTTLARDAVRGGIHLTPIDADADKVTRALPYSARVSGGRVWLPAGAGWTSDWVDEHAAFPNGRHDDQCDVGGYAVRVAVTRWTPPPPQPAPMQRTADPLAALGGGNLNFMSVPL